MTNDQIRRKIAEACGWICVSEKETSPGRLKLCGQNPDRTHPDAWDLIPAYTSSHDAMAQALGALSDGELHDVAYDLEGMYGTVGWELSSEILRVTPIKKAEAFLRAKGLWEEGK